VTLRKINNLLLLLIILINGYVIVMPFLPAFEYNLGNHQAKEKSLQKLIAPPAKVATPTSAPKPNQVIIPSMLLDQPIYDGPESQQYTILDQGKIWRFSWGSTPDKGGNTVLIGHRFTYTNPRGVFYYMNKVQLGDDIGVIWNNKQYSYKVVSITEVPPTDISVEAPSKQAELTLFTCTPLLLPKDRLVVVADLETSSE
jgi:LPXTG-site transpeptidase (sortase) family protein